VLSFDRLDASQLTSVEDFLADFTEIVQRLHALGSPVVFANIPDVTRIGFLLDRQDLIKFLGSGFGLAEGDFTSIVVMFLVRLGLDDGSLLRDPNFVLDASEVDLNRERVQTFNRIIEDTAEPYGMPVVNINALMDTVANNPPVIFDVALTTRFLGGFLSLDGVHPSNFGHAVLANAFIQTINAHFQINIPPISEATRRFIFLTDPFIDKDGDGRVRGRRGAGLLETLGPLLRISGDQNDFRPDPFRVGIDGHAGKRFMERFLVFQGTSLLEADEWDRQDVIEAFRHIFGLRFFGKLHENKTPDRNSEGPTLD
jgi:hypothetical protein